MTLSQCFCLLLLLKFADHSSRWFGVIAFCQSQEIFQEWNHHYSSDWSDLNCCRSSILMSEFGDYSPLLKKGVTVLYQSQVMLQRLSFISLTWICAFDSSCYPICGPLFLKRSDGVFLKVTWSWRDGFISILLSHVSSVGVSYQSCCPSMVITSFTGKLFTRFIKVT